MKRIAFDCRKCGEPLDISERKAGHVTTCPACNGPVTVPGATSTPPASAGGDKKHKVKMTLGKYGGIEAEVDKKGAERAILVGAGGIMALLGVILCALLGIRYRP